MEVRFEDYLATWDAANNASLEQQQKAFKSVLEPLRLVGWAQSYLNDYRQSPPPSEPRALYVIGAQTTQLAIGIHASLSAGVVFPAAGNFRTLFELLLSTKLIRHADTQQRSDLFMNFSKALQWDHLNKQRKAGIVDPVSDPTQIQTDYDAVKDRYSSKPTYWWSEIMWSPDDARARNSMGPVRASAFLDNHGVRTGIPSFPTFAELEVRWYGTFSTQSHSTVLGANGMMVQRQRSMGWQIDANVTRLASLAVAACAEIISECEDGLRHPKARWCRMFLGDLRDKAIIAQGDLEHRSRL